MCPCTQSIGKNTKSKRKPRCPVTAITTKFGSPVVRSRSDTTAREKASFNSGEQAGKEHEVVRERVEGGGETETHRHTAQSFARSDRSGQQPQPGQPVCIYGTAGLPIGSPGPAQVNSTDSSGAQNTSSPTAMGHCSTLVSDPAQANSDSCGATPPHASLERQF